MTLSAAPRREVSASRLVAAVVLTLVVPPVGVVVSGLALRDAVTGTASAAVRAALAVLVLVGLWWTFMLLGLLSMETRVEVVESSGTAPLHV